MMLIVIPANDIHMIVMTRESGIDMDIMSVLLKFCKKTNKMITASSKPCHAEVTSVLIVSRIAVVSSEMISSVISDGRVACTCSIFLYVAFATVTEFVPDCFVIETYTPGSPFM